MLCNLMGSNHSIVKQDRRQHAPHTPALTLLDFSPDKQRGEREIEGKRCERSRLGAGGGCESVSPCASSFPTETSMGSVYFSKQEYSVRGVINKREYTKV